MKLWIRSQNKSVLKEAQILNCYYSDKKHCIDCNGYCVGYYRSRERCIEIIDEVQKLLRGDLTMFLSACNIQHEIYRDLVGKKPILYEPNIEYHQSNVMVYEMPEN